MVDLDHSSFDWCLIVCFAVLMVVDYCLGHHVGAYGIDHADVLEDCSKCISLFESVLKLVFVGLLDDCGGHWSCENLSQ